MSNVQSLIADNLDVWTTIVQKKSSSGRGTNKKINLYGIKKLRELILQLAVMGKLVPQDPSDEPASVLLDKIAAEKQKLVKEGKIKKKKPLPPISDDEKPFDLPVGWLWERVGNISANIHYGYTASADNNLKDVRLLRITDIQNDRVDWSSVPGCEIDTGKLEQYLLENHDILIARTGGTIGKSYLVQNIDVCSVFASYLIRTQHLNEMYSKFLKVYLGSQLYWKQLYANSMGTGQPNVNATALKSLNIPLPPKAEQHRIVAKVDELMALCDQLEQQTEDSIGAHRILVETLLASLTESKDAEEFSQNWERIAEHFDTLFATEDSIDQLKQTILQLAVMGKLVPQDPNDEPASVLLKKIGREKLEYIDQNKIRVQKFKTLLTSEIPFDLPVNWQWSDFEAIINFITDFQANGSFATLKANVTYYQNPNYAILVRLVDLRTDLKNKENLVYTGKHGYEFLSKSSLHGGELLVANVGAGVGTTKIMPEIKSLATLAPNMFKVILSSQIKQRYFYLFGKSPLYWQMVNELNAGTGQPKINKRGYKSIKIPIPPLKEQPPVANSLFFIRSIASGSSINP